MKLLSHKITIITVLLLSAFQFPSMVTAAELYRQFSVGKGSVSSAPADAKTQETGYVTAKYGFRIAKDFMPYMGTGLAYSYQPDTQTGDKTKLRTGVAAQLGFNYLLGTHLLLKFDYNYLSLPPDQQRRDSATPPQSLGIGFDIRF